MEREGSSAVVTEVPPSSSSAAASAPASAAVESIHEEAVHTILNESMEPATYPERPGKQDCAYYIRTGLCRFGMSCKFNHPSNRKLAVAAARNNGGYPERLGQPECQYYLKTGTCKFGATCKFHHPRDKAGIDGQVQFNSLGYPLRLNEKECTYYLRTGQCKFGSTCKFHHPQPSNAMVAAPVYTSSNSPTNPNQQSYPGGLTNWALPRASFIPSPRWQGHSTYTQLILPQGVVQVPNWTPYSAHLGSSSLESQQTLASSQTNVGVLGTSSSYRSGSFPMGMYSVQQESIYPERPDQPECQFYMKTGDCKFGAVCKFNHPRERSIPPPDCALNPLGLPLRPGEPVCGFYSRYGICKFGPNCKFDHPIATFAYGPSTAPGGSVPAVRYILGSPSGTSSAYSMQDPPSVSRKVSTANENAEEYI